ncbi:GNAT family N-acetyltransferase [Cohnella sp. REN36]|uniref:GNAT family N-acetyltransferase n=1 Tax=Cohnella sp. REN36 TaxID=2887347 RepID=UPI001D154B3C|nr:GNAT family N-acetyltransferase [Cohnella sp. REN36]MCC3373061.1 N-acetyltransferase family protein [Cohnella sp. REN36]
MLSTRLISSEDWEAVKAIYEEGILTGNATFETNVPAKDNWFSSRVLECSIVCLDDDKIVGWASLSPVSSRCVYKGVGENSIYVKQDQRGKGVGDYLLGQLIKAAEKTGVWTIQTGIFPENTISIALHLKHGFREVGVRSRIGKMDGVWRDVLFMERRSEVVGVD